jgi:hypothetical protein
MDKQFTEHNLDGTDLNAGRGPATSERIRALKDEIADLKKRWPAHSTPPAMLQRLDDLEEELDEEMKKQSLQSQAFIQG